MEITLPKLLDTDRKNRVILLLKEKECAIVNKQGAFTCIQCGVLKPYSCFHKKTSSKQGIRTVCIDCVKKQFKEHVVKNISEKSTSICRTCGAEKVLSDFYKDRHNKKGHTNDCKECKKIYAKKLSSLENNNAYMALYRKADPRRSMLANAKYRAKKEGIPFSIVLDDIFIPKTCPIFGTALNNSPGYYGGDLPSLDRVNPSLGYVPGNVSVISYRANRIKSDATVEELFSIIRYIKSFSNVNCGQIKSDIRIFSPIISLEQTVLSSSELPAGENRT